MGCDPDGHEPIAVIESQRTTTRTLGDFRPGGESDIAPVVDKGYRSSVGFQPRPGFLVFGFFLLLAMG